MTTGARLRAYVAVAELGSVRAAAQRLYVTESSVSAAVSALSRELGVALVERRGRGVQITPAGEIYAQYARTILGLHDEALAAARGEFDPGQGQIRLAAVTTAAEHVLPEMLVRFRTTHARMSLTLSVVTREQIWPMLERHEVDVVIAGRPPANPAMHTRALRANELIAVAAPECARRFSLDSTTWLMRELGSGTRATCEALLVNADAQPPQLTLGSNGAVVAGAMAGLGVTLVSREAVRAQLRDARLVELEVPGLPLGRPWHAVTHRRTTAQVGLFVSLLVHRNDPDDPPTWRTPGD
jgi:LysR family transcriptional regulator, low CO2-responsive transcriptional regulator